MLAHVRLASCVWAAALAAIVAGCAAPPAERGARERHAPRRAWSVDQPKVRALPSPGWVEVIAQVVASDDESPTKARGRALAKARLAAVEFVAGVTVRSGLLSFEQVRGESASSLIQVLSSVRAEALLIEEQLVDARSIDMPGDGYIERIVLRGRVLDRKASKDSCAGAGALSHGGTRSCGAWSAVGSRRGSSPLL